MTLLLSCKQKDIILEELENVVTPQAHTFKWSRRLYAPMLIHRHEMRNVKRIIQLKYPEYEVTFDVIFESQGNRTPWHCDYESLGPFIVSHPLRAIRDEHFLSVHFNLTSNGGSLTVLPWTYLSYIHYKTIVLFGIFTRIHSCLILLSSPFLCMCSKKHPNNPTSGNVFNNMKLHAVSAGMPRTSYVVRLAKKGCVGISRESIFQGMQRSDACWVFKDFFCKVREEAQDVSEIAWSNSEA